MAADSSSNGSTPMAKDDTLDDELYNRQLYVLGHDAMRKMLSANVLIVGLNGLGVETAKNVILAGVKSVTLLDEAPVELRDLSSQFFLTEADVGKRRDEACAAKLRELNRYVPVSVANEPLSESLIRSGGFAVVVLINVPVAEQLRLDAFCHANNVKLIAADIRGVMAYCFVDFGKQFSISDTTGEPPVGGIVTSITKETEGIVTVSDLHRHGLETGDYVAFEEVEGMTELNTSEPLRVTVKGPFTFSIGDTSAFGDYSTGGVFVQIKQPKTVDFASMESTLANPPMVYSDFMKIDNALQLHALYQALSQFQAEHDGKLPQPHVLDDARVVLAHTKTIAAKLENGADLAINDELILQLARCSSACINPMAAFLGGVVAQEVLKATSGKFSPIQQYMYFDASEVLPENEPIESFAPAGSRYDDQIAVIGARLQAQLREQSWFLVGAGAIGCEMLKNWAMMGVSSAGADKAKIHVTDMDMIEKSNLSRQFLFRTTDVGSAKSKAAAHAAKKMNADVTVLSALNKVGPDTENVYDDAFWDSIDGVCTALDNVQARLYMDSRCVFYKKAMLESGTLGTKGNTQVVVPDVTESYGASRDPPEQGIPICTLKNFPNKIEHCIQWARDLFEGAFFQAPGDANQYLDGPAVFLKQLEKQSAQQLDTLQRLEELLVAHRPTTFADCVAWARLKFESLFNHTIEQLLFNFPKDSVTSQGAKFWSGPKRAPDAIRFDPADPLHMSFIIHGSLIYARVFGLAPSAPAAQQADIMHEIRAALEHVTVPDFKPKSGVKIAANDEEMEESGDSPSAGGDEIDTQVSSITSALPQAADFPKRLVPEEFEKDDAFNGHVSFVTAVANLRARNYTIKEVSEHECKKIAGKIIPAIATTTALVTGLVCLEMLKVLQRKPIEKLKNGFVNLALPLFAFSEPVPPAKQKSKLRGAEWEFTQWDRLEVDGTRGASEMTMKEFIEHFEKEYGLEISMLSWGPTILHSFFASAKKTAERANQPLSVVATTVGKRDVLPQAKYMVLEACVTDPDNPDDDEDVEIPYIRYKFRA